MCKILRKEDANTLGLFSEEMGIPGVERQRGVEVEFSVNVVGGYCVGSSRSLYPLTLDGGGKPLGI